MIDLTEYSDNELSLTVYNHEGLYLMRHDYGLLDELKEWYLFTDAQRNVLFEDLEGELL